MEQVQESVNIANEMLKHIFNNNIQGAALDKGNVDIDTGVFNDAYRIEDTGFKNNIFMIHSRIGWINIKIKSSANLFEDMTPEEFVKKFNLNINYGMIKGDLDLEKALDTFFDLELDSLISLKYIIEKEPSYEYEYAELVEGVWIMKHDLEEAQIIMKKHKHKNPNK